MYLPLPSLEPLLAACLYIVCRREKSHHLLIDFAERLRTNVYVLGATYVKFVRLLNLELPVIDPSLYIHRFAQQLDLGDETNAVANTALRLVARMRRDWIQTGRRPAGICGACLLVAARGHGFRRSSSHLADDRRDVHIAVPRHHDEVGTRRVRRTETRAEVPGILDAVQD